MGLIPTKRKLEPDLDEKVANRMLSNIFNACSVTPNAIPFSELKSWGNYKRTGLGFCKVLSAIFMIILLLVPVFFVPSTMQMTDLAQFEGTRIKMDFVVDSLLPVFKVEAQMNGKALNVIPVEYNHFTTNVARNGSLEVTITLINGRSTEYDFTVESILEDTEPPEITSSELARNELTVHVTDKGSVVDFAAAFAVNEKGETVQPISYDENAGTIVFPYYYDNTNLFIPDTSGNALQAVVSSKKK